MYILKCIPFNTRRVKINCQLPIVEHVIKMKKSTISLKTLSINTVVTEIWRNTGLVDSLAKASESFAKIHSIYILRCNTYTEKIEEAKKPFYMTLEGILRKIQALENAPGKLRNQIALSLMKLEADIAEFTLDILDLLCKKSNIGYCIHKMWINIDGELDRSETICQILRHSYLQVDFCWDSMPNYCCMPPYFMYRLMQDLVMCNEKEGHRKIWIMANDVCLRKVLRHWKQTTIDAGSEDFHPNKVQIFDYMAVHAPLQVLQYFYQMLKMDFRAVIIPTALVWLLLSNTETPEKIIYLSTKVTQRDWQIILSRYHECIFRKLFLTYYSEYCINYFIQLCKLNKLDVCKSVLIQVLRMLCVPTLGCKYDCENIVYTNSRQTFLGMWHTAPDSIKANLGRDFLLYLDCILERKDFDLLNILISDRTFDSVQKTVYIVHVASRLLLEEDSTKLEEAPKEYLQFVEMNIDLEMLKAILAIATKTAPHYDALSALLQTTSKSYMKQNITKDSDFMIDTLAKRLLVPEQNEEIKQNDARKFLQWCFDDDEHKIEDFIQNKLSTELWLVDIYKKYLLETSSNQVTPTQRLFEIFNVEESTKIQIKEMVREDSKLYKKLLANFTVPNFCDVSLLLDCLYTEYDKCNILEDYLLSNDGLLLMYKLINSDYYNDDLYAKNGLFKTVEHYAELGENWLNICSSKRLKRKLKMANVWKYAQERNNGPLLLSESYDQNKMIVEAKYRIFIVMAKHYYVIYRNLNYIENGISESLTDFSLWLETR